MRSTQAERSWSSFYEGRHGGDYLDYVKSRYAIHIEAISSRLETGDMVLEIGAGTATITRSVIDKLSKSEDVEFVASDIDDHMRRSCSLRLMGTNARVVDHDARMPFPTYADVVHSHGLLEHFGDDTIRSIIAAHRCARAQIHYVPGKYPKPSFGDERLMTAGEWQQICNPSEIVHFNGGLDFLLIFERTNQSKDK